jgi:hypothetical protein
MKHARNDGPDLAFRLARRVVSTVADDMSTMQRVGAGIVAALLALTPFGAWSEAEAQADPLVTGAPVQVGPFEVEVVKAATVPEFAYITPQPGNHLLGVVAEVTNTGEVPEYSVTLTRAVLAPRDVGIVPEAPLEELGTDFGADGGTDGAPDGTADPSTDPSAEPSASATPEEPAEPELPTATILSATDGTSIKFFNPGVTHRVALIWEQSDKWSGTAVPIEVLELEWIEDDPQGLDDGHWFPNEVAFHGEIPIEKKKPGADANGQAASEEAGQQ